MMKPELIISIAALLFSGISVYINILYRKKDFYNQLLREQISAGSHIMETLLRLNNAYLEGYNKHVGAQMGNHLASTGSEPDTDKMRQWQTDLHIHMNAQYKEAFGSVAARGFLFPAEFQKELTGYFELLANIIENKNDEDLGMQLSGLNGPLANLTDSLNHYLKVDALSKRLHRLL
jgi:hypothetical protein